jgi:hypothetical protein
MNENATKIFIVFLDAMVQLANVRLIQKAQDLLLELPAPFAGDNLDELNAFVARLLHDAVQFGVNLRAAIVDVVQIQFEFRHR